VWGDLWLTEDALVRLSRGMPETREAAGQRKDRGKGSTVTDPIPAVTPEELDARVSGDKRNRRAPLAEIRTAKLRRGLLNGRVSLVLHDGTRIKWLWLKHDPAHDVLKDVLAPHLR